MDLTQFGSSFFMDPQFENPNISPNTKPPLLPNSLQLRHATAQELLTPKKTSTPGRDEKENPFDIMFGAELIKLQVAQQRPLPNPNKMNHQPLMELNVNNVLPNLQTSNFPAAEALFAMQYVATGGSNQGACVGNELDSLVYPNTDHKSAHYDTLDQQLYPTDLNAVPFQSNSAFNEHMREPNFGNRNNFDATYTIPALNHQPVSNPAYTFGSTVQASAIAVPERHGCTATSMPSSEDSNQLRVTCRTKDPRMTRFMTNFQLSQHAEASKNLKKDLDVVVLDPDTNTALKLIQYDEKNPFTGTFSLKKRHSSSEIVIPKSGRQTNQEISSESDKTIDINAPPIDRKAKNSKSARKSREKKKLLHEQLQRRADAMGSQIAVLKAALATSEQKCNVLYNNIFAYKRQVDYLQSKLSFYTTSRPNLGELSDG